MDLMIMAIVAVLIAIIGVLIAFFKKKSIRKIFVYAIFGLIVGCPVGYFLAPIIISFF